MKKYCLLLTAFSLIWITLSGKIKNGYDNEINIARESLKNLAMLAGDKKLSGVQAAKVDDGIQASLDIVVYYEVTEILLDHFRTIAPELYNEVDTIKDAYGHTVDVFIRFVPPGRTKVKAWGTTYFGQDETDEHINQSEYGHHTVSVKIWTVSTALLVLAHELGHVHYQIPNLASYVKFYNEKYTSQNVLVNDIGHRPDDPSGKRANLYVKRYRDLYYNYLKAKDAEKKKPLAILNAIRRGLHADMEARINFHS